MEKYAVLLGYFNKQLAFIHKIREEVISINLSVYENRFVFALRVQQLYTACEDLFKQIAKAFENHIDTLSHFHKELLSRMNTEIPKIRPQVLSDASCLFFDKLRSFRHFIRHAYNCELDEKELKLLQDKLKQESPRAFQELEEFRSYIQAITSRDTPR